MRKLFSFFILLIVLSVYTPAQSYKILESNNERLKVEFNFNGVYQIRDTSIDARVYQMISGGEPSARKPGEPWLPEYSINIAIPFNSNPMIQTIQVDKTILQHKFVLPFPEEDPEISKINTDKFNKVIYSSNQSFPNKPAQFGDDFIMRYSRIIPLRISPYQYNPVTHELVTNKKVIVSVLFNTKNSNKISVSDETTNEYLKSSVVNYSQAVQWTGKSPANVLYGGAGYGNYWYNPNKNYFKIYLRNKGVYRITFDQLINAGVPIQGGVSSDVLELVNNGTSIPIDIVDGGDGIFNSGDYFQFVGTPPVPTAYCNMNIYNKSNVFWFSYQSDTLSARYEIQSGYPQNWGRTFDTDYYTDHYEKDSLYETLGYAGDDHRDFWFWGKATAQNGQSTGGFETPFTEFSNWISDSPHVKLRVGLQGMTLSGNCTNNHDAEIQLTDQIVGHALWGDQNAIIYEKNLYVSEDSIHIYPQGNRFTVYVRGNTCETSDEIRINWFEFKYWRVSRTSQNHYEFTSPPGFTGTNRYWLTHWLRDNMKIYIPGQNLLLNGPEIRNDQYNSALFVDNVTKETEYFCVADDYFLSPDSIRQDIPSDLRNPSNGADYIIITHPDFMDAAQRLKVLREAQYPDSEIVNPRIKIVDINQIYDEFSYGLLDPQSLRYFVQYAFENWQSPAPAYVVLFGDMSHDYRHLLASSRPNFIPALPFYVNTYGRAPSDNLIVNVAGNDLAPDLAIGRMSCENMEQANVLMDKLENYPEDNSKSWKQDVMLASSGLSLDDELHFHFNLYSNRLADNFLIPNGIHPSRVFNFPSNHEDSMYIGGGPRIRQEIDEGVVIGNYYGHGGGYQWDLIFTNDDIALLQNDGRLPVIMSVTCYTAHFDNQDVFGEIFNRKPEGGSIGFFGNTVLTYWPIGAIIDEAIFNQIFNQRVYTIGKAILNAKNQVGSGGYYGQQITLLTYLGDPGMKLALPDKPDFLITPSDISISKQNPLVNDTVKIKARISNLGVTFPGDTINVEFFAESADTSYLISTVRLPSFGDLDSAIIDWTPNKASLYNITVKVNELDPIEEDDHSDNVASNAFVVYNVSEANVLFPQDGFSSSEPVIKFKFVDIGDYLNLTLTYDIEIDTSLNFNSPVISSGTLTPADGFLQWTTPQLPSGVYFWRVKIFDGSNNGPWSVTRSFSILQEAKPGFYAFNRGLKLFSTYNLNYSDSSNSLILNTSPLPPRPSVSTFIEDLSVDSALVDTVGMTAITTDGTYIYFGNIWYFAQNSNTEQKSKIYKIGTGYNGTIKGQYYGEIPNFFERIANSIVYLSDGYIYVTESNPFYLVRVDPVNGDTAHIAIPDGLLEYEHARPVTGSFYIKSDGQYVYNLTVYDSLGHSRYVLRIFDPSNGWNLLRPDITLESTSYQGFCDFFAADGYIYATENYQSNYMRRIRIDDGYFEEEWITNQPFQGYYGWCYDWDHDKVIASVFRADKTPKISVFEGRYVDATGVLTTRDIGPASKWNNVNYGVDLNSTGSFHNVLYGLNKSTKDYDTIAVDIPNNYSLQNISTSDYLYLKISFSFTDTTFNTTNPMLFRDLNLNYDGLPEIMVTRKDLNVSPDSVLQGTNTTMYFSVRNVGVVPADSINLNFYFNGSDSVFYNSKVNIAADSTAQLQYTFSSTPFIFDNSIKVIATYPKSEYFTFNNITDHDFYIVRDSVSPIFNISFDGKEIVDGDLVSSKPEVVITLKDNSPLPLDTSYFTLIHTEDGIANILHFSDPDLNYTSVQNPNSEFKSEAQIIWHPDLKEGEHILEVLAKDASGNFFDTTSYRIRFEVVTEYDLRDVYNYPNPFKDGTYFTFKITGDQIPDELYVKIYTVAGRLIRTIDIPPAELGQDVGFKKVYWNGRDQDGDEIANGVYFYKMIYKVKDVVKSVTQKLAKVK